MATWRFLRRVAAETSAPPFRALGDTAAQRSLVPSDGLATRGLLQGVAAETSVPPFRVLGRTAARRFLVPTDGARVFLQGVTVETPMHSFRAFGKDAGTPSFRGARFGSNDKERGHDFCGVSTAENSQENNKSSIIFARAP